jgi:hypothetical protein
MPTARSALQIFFAASASWEAYDKKTALFVVSLMPGKPIPSPHRREQSE